MSKASYVERALMSYFVDKFLGGFRVLMQKKFLPFTLLLFLIIGIDLTSIILYFQEISWMTEEFLYQLFINSFIFACSLIILGLTSAIWKNQLFQTLFVIIGSLGIVTLSWIFNFHTYEILFEGLQLGFILIWVTIAAFSTYFAILYLFTSISGKVLVAGKDDDHIFMGNIIRFVALGTLVLAIIIIIQNLTSLHALILAGLAIFVSVGLLIYSWTAKLDKTTTNFISIIGIYNLYITYHLSVSITPSDELKNIFTEIMLFVLIALYYISSRVRKVRDIDDERLESKMDQRKIFFQQRLILSELMKKLFGEFSLVIVAIAITLGYSLVLLYLVIDPSLPLVSNLNLFAVDIGIPLFSHRLTAFIALGIMIGSFLIFKTSENYRKFVTNNYDFQQGVKILGDKVSAWGRRVKNRFKRGD